MDLTLPEITRKLAGLEEAIIHKLLDRAQFCQNADAYAPGESGFLPQETASLFELRLLYQETMDAQFGRYLMPEERPFYEGLPLSKRTVRVKPGTDLFIKELETINVSGKILTAYMDLLPHLCPTGDDGHHGSAVEHDVMVLQALARRIHFASLYVAESKYMSDPIHFRELIEAKAEASIMNSLTRKAVEEEVLARVRKKTASIQAAADPASRILVDPEVIVKFYKDWIIPLTKEGEVRYLLQRPL